MATNDEIVETSLQAIAGAAALFPPFGTVASAAIMGGIFVKNSLDAIEANEEIVAFQKHAMIEAKKMEDLTDSVYDAAKRRPRVPLDLYSAPPMYWIFAGKPTGLDKPSFKIPGGKVDWPESTKGGSTLYDIAGFDKNKARINSLFAPFAPEIVPKLGVFFWAVPLFFARLQEKIGLIVFGPSHNPQDQADVSRFGGKTKEQVSSSIMKDILHSGEFDKYGNWFATIGSAIPPLAVNDGEFASRYYGRQLWAHNIAKKQMSYSDGTALCDTRIGENSFGEKSEIAERIKIAGIRRNECPRIMKVPGSPYGTFATTTEVNLAGQLMDLKTLLSNYYIDDDRFRTFKPEGGINLNIEAKDDDEYLYYVTVVDAAGPANPPEDLHNARSELCAGNQLSIVSRGISSAGSFTGYYADAAKNSQFFKGLSLCPYQYAIHPYIRAKELVENAEIDKQFSSTGFYDFFQGESSVGGLPGAVGVVKDSAITTLKRLSTTPLVSGEYGPAFCDSISKSTFRYVLRTAPPVESRDAYVLVGTTKNEDLSAGMRKAYLNSGIAVTNWGGYNSILMYTARMLQFMPSVLLNSKYDKLSKTNTKWIKPGDSVVLSGSVDQISPKVYPIIKLREPSANEKYRIWLPQTMYGDAKWAKRIGWDEFAIAQPNLPQGKRLAVFRIRLSEQQAFVGKEGQPKIGFFCKSNFEENKPLVNAGAATPSPFYCGRKADGRTGFAWKQIRDSTSRFGKKASEKNTDTGWEDCHDWSWPYPTKYLNDIGRISAELCNKYGEGIGRCGLSPSSVATGPTLWGDISLFNKVLPEFVYDNIPSSPGFIATKARVIWESLIEVQVGANTRYGFRTCEQPKSYTELIEKTYGIFSNSENSYNHYLKFAEDKNKSGVSPKIWIPSEKKWQALTPKQAAEYCVKVIDVWYRDMVPVPNKDHSGRYEQSVWTVDLLKSTVEAHILLKNWAISRSNQPFPKIYYSINTLSALSVKNRIIQYNPYFLQEKMPRWDSAVPGPKVPQDAKPKSSINNGIKIAGGVAALCVAAAIIYAVSRSSK